MQIPSLHPWNLDYESARRFQRELSARLDLKPRPLEPSIIAGCDVSNELGSSRFFAAVVLLSFPDFTILEEVTAERIVNFPYIPGLLSFREMPALLEAWRKIQRKTDLIFCDGSGTIHPRRFGLACHLGLWLNISTIGCAKNLLCGKYNEVAAQKGDWENVYLEGEAVGAALRTRTNTKTMFISPGNLISLEQAVDFTLKVSPKYRIPEPIRAAHNSANNARRSANI